MIKAGIKRCFVEWSEMVVQQRGGVFQVSLPCFRGNGNEMMEASHEKLAVALDLAVGQILDCDSDPLAVDHQVREKTSEMCVVVVEFTDGSTITAQGRDEHLAVLEAICAHRNSRRNGKPELSLPKALSF